MKRKLKVLFLIIVFLGGIIFYALGHYQGTKDKEAIRKKEDQISRREDEDNREKRKEEVENIDNETEEGKALQIVEETDEEGTFDDLKKGFKAVYEKYFSSNYSFQTGYRAKGDPYIFLGEDEGNEYLLGFYKQEGNKIYYVLSKVPKTAKSNLFDQEYLKFYIYNTENGEILEEES